MMEFVSHYVAKKPDAKGYIAYTTQENYVWSLLYRRQLKLIQGRACEAFIQGLEILAKHLLRPHTYFCM